MDSERGLQGVEVRHLEAFLLVAEELNFTRIRRSTTAWSPAWRR